MKTMRLVVAGTPGAGKSTLVRTISDIQFVDTDRIATDATSLLKQKTTVAFDFGRIAFGSSMEVQIYGTPGQSRFNFMWDFLIQRAHAYILLVAAHRPSDFRHARDIVSFMNQRVQIPMIVGITHTDRPGAYASHEIMIRLGYINKKNQPPVVKVNPTERASVVEVLMTSMAVLLSQCNSAQPVNREKTSQPIQNHGRSTDHLPAQQVSNLRSSTILSASLQR